jgi:anti-anti-sigma factor
MKVLNKDKDKFVIVLENSDTIGKNLELLSEKLKNILQNASEIEINMKNVDYVASSFVDLIENLVNEIQTKAGKIIIKNCNDRIKDLFKTLGKDLEIFK